jgi:hypothetical protein
MIAPQSPVFQREILAKEEARFKMILGQNSFDGLKSFFRKIMKEQQNKKMCCVAFITRRCFCLAHIFLQILKQDFFYSTDRSKFLLLQGKDENKGNVTLMTDTALVNYGWKIGQKIARIAADDNAMPGRDELTYLPDIVLVDDAISYGRALTGVMESFQRKIEEGVCSYFEEKRIKEPRDFEKEERRAQLLREDYLKNRVEIHIYAEKKQTKVLGMLHQRLLTTYERMDPPYWNDLSVSLS